MMDPNQPQPYQQYPVPQPQTVPYSRACHITKILLISFSMMFCLIVLGISIALIVDPNLYSPMVVWIAPQAGIAFCWSVAELMTICARTGHRGIHPGAHVALHLLLWMGFSTSVGLTSYFLAEAVGCDYYCSHYSSYYDVPRYSQGYINAMGALVAFLSLLIIIHFSLFIRACVETAQRNRMTMQVYFVPQHVYYGQPLQQYPVSQGIPPMRPQQAQISGYYGQPKVEQVTESSSVS
ncbi:uncharacterized protein BCR38DRAFT_517907 [Pseudomassariella vexata]|uniref:MARVEL domain-containing protein n=1 Tax=Pseudomassariella vexata TaxID=1141098 RepID=A0A1Y2DTC1_9PEZI|nr:uncharacterized protein BCR38DRAFT_517907 [Pseudomassariella vexata]ORY62386.1 hypothetical protein BCR38DRAFT_517907 [Pseudomassariella vexata]